MLALSVCPLRGSQLPQRGSQVVRRFRYAKLQFEYFLNDGYSASGPGNSAVRAETS